jgi:type I restriction enzyme, S subunit
MSAALSPWPIVPLGNIACVSSGGTPSRKIPAYWSGDIPWITTSLIDFNEIHAAEEFITTEGVMKSSAKVYPKGTLLMAMFGQGVTRGKVAVLGIDAAFNQACVGITPVRGINAEYLYQFLANNYNEIRQLSNSGSQENLNAGLIKGIGVPMPSIDEQIGIAHLGSTWDRAIRQLKDLIVAKHRSRNGFVQRLLSGSLRFQEYEKCVPEKVSLIDVLTKVADSVDLNHDEMYREIGVRSHGKGIFHKEPVTGRSLGNKRVYRVVPGCLTLNIVFAWERAVAITTDDEDGMIASHRFPMFRPDGNRLLAEYALLYLLSKKGAESLGLASPGGAGRNRTLSQTDFLKNRIPLPSLAEQRRIVNFVLVADKEIDLLQKQLELLKLQKKGLMQKLFNGKVRVKLPKGAK